MATIPCVHGRRDCDCGATESPFLNLSAEAPDPPLYLPYVDRPGPYGDTGSWWAPACGIWFFSTVSQADATMMAQIAATQCAGVPPGDPDTCDPSVSICDDTPGGSGGGGGGQRFALYSAEKQCTYDCGNGITSIYTVPSGTVVAFTQILADTYAQALCEKRVKENPLCFDPDIPVGCWGQDYSFQFVGTGGTPPYEFNTSGVGLPGGYGLTSYGLLSGFNGLAGLFTFDVTMTDQSVPPRVATGNVTLRVVQITSSATLPEVTVGVPYSHQFTATGTQGTLSWTLFSGSLPDGLTLDETTGLLSGTPTAPYIGSFVVLLQDNAT